MTRLHAPTLAIRSMQGLGDNIYQRALLKHLVVKYEIWLDTSWPELYTDLPIHIVKPLTKYRTQAKNINRYFKWERQPLGIREVRWHYCHFKGSMLAALEQSIGIHVGDIIDFSGPPVTPTVRARPYMVVRPPTVRREWSAPSRNPLPEYVRAASLKAARKGYEIISVADLLLNEEWIVGAVPFAHKTYHRGELSTSDLLSLVAGASGVIGGVGWALPAALAYRVPMLCIFGGCGAHNAPARVLDTRIDCSQLVQAVPTNFCMCSAPEHNCDKRMNLEPYLESYFRLAAETKTSVAA